MKHHIEVVQNAAALVELGETGPFVRGRFVDCFATLHLARCGRFVDDPRLSPVLDKLREIQEDLWCIGALLERLEWMRQACLKGIVSDSLWSQWGALDIEHFHVLVRSLLDYAAFTISTVSQRPDCVPKDSFRALRQWLESNPGNANRLGEDLVRLVRAAEWFPSLRDIRDSVVHGGAHTLVFGRAEDGILFQVHAGFRNKVREDTCMFNENVVEFRRYGVLVFARLLILLEELADCIVSRLSLEQFRGRDSRCSGAGLAVFKRWAEEYRRTLTSSPAD